MDMSNIPLILALISGAKMSGANGKSAYEVAVENGFVGTVTEWLDSLVGDDGKSAYEIALEAGFVGTKAEWLESLKGKAGDFGATFTPSVDPDGTLSWENNKGLPNPKPVNIQGQNGKSAYAIAVENGYIGTEEQWLVSLHGANGKSAYEIAREAGYTGTEEAFSEALCYAGSVYNISDALYHQLVLKAKTESEVNNLFATWWKANESSAPSRTALMKRWFGNVLYDDLVHGVKSPLFSTSQSVVGEFTDDSVGLSCTPSTATVAGKDDFAFLPQFWCLEVAMERHADGGHEIIKVEHIDPISEVRSGNYGMCQVLQKNTFTKEWVENGYHYFKMCCDPADKTGWETWEQGSNKNGTVYPYMANPKYYAGLDANGIPTSGTGLPPMNWTSHNAGVTAWRKRGAQYSGASGSLLKFQLRMMWLKYARKGNSGTIEGCSSYNFQYTAAASETGVKRVLLTAAQAGNLLVGSSVQLGVQSGTDRNTPSNYSITRNAPITSIEDVTVGGTAYKAVNIGVSAPFDTVAGSTYLSTTPYASGYNDTVKGFDGSRTNYTNGKEPGLIQKTEFQNGSYLILSDELWQWSTDADGNICFDVYTCHDQSKVTTNGTISSDYTKQEDLTLKWPNGTKAGWQYIEDIAVSNDKGVLWPAKVSTAAGSGTGVKAGMYVEAATSGVRAAWCCSYLGHGGSCGLAARTSYYSTTLSPWYGSVGCPSGISG